MKLTITATDKKQERDFHYNLEVSSKQIQNTLMIFCATILLASLIKNYAKKGSK